MQQADILQSRALDKIRSEKENGSSVNYESAVSEICNYGDDETWSIDSSQHTHMWVKKEITTKHTLKPQLERIKLISKLDTV